MVMHVYILTNASTSSLYVGVTSNLAQRVWKHNTEFYDGSYTSKYHVNRLVYYETYENPEAAIMSEKQLKLFRRQKEIDLITKFNPTWIDLYEDTYK
jgi:putative endonuclease